MKRVISILLLFVLVCTLALTCACQVNDITVNVMVLDGKHFHVVGSSIQRVAIGSDVQFQLSFDEGYYYVTDDSDGVFEGNVLTLHNVRTPKSVTIYVEGETFDVKLYSANGMKLTDGSEEVTSLSHKVVFGESTSFDVAIDEKYELIGFTTGNGESVDARYVNGKIVVNNVRKNVELYVQLNKISTEEDFHVVELLRGRGYTVVGESSKTVANGSDVVFNVVITDGYSYVANNCGAEFVDGKLTLANVRASQEITIVTMKQNAERVSYANGVVEISAEDDGYNYSAVPDDGYMFAGWHTESENGLVPYSYVNNCTFTDKVDVQPRFVSRSEGQFVVYHANGGNTCNSDDDSVTYWFSSPVYMYPTTFGEWCFNSFEREGYVPIEYNTMPDGSGQAFSLGTKLLNDNQIVHLYLTWAKVTDIANFDYSTREGNNGNEIVLENYHGSDTEVVIPLEVDGVPVSVIGKQCFNACDVEQVVITRNVTEVQEDAFHLCHKLETLYLCDNVRNIKNNSFTECENFANLRMIAVLPPVYTNNVVGAIPRRIEWLYAHRNDSLTTVITYGGSSIFQGVDGATMNELLMDGTQFINGGQNAYISGPLILDVYSHFLRERDVVVFIPELTNEVSSATLVMPAWVTLETYYDAFRLVDIRNFSKVIDSFYDVQNGSVYYTFPGKFRSLDEGNALTYETYNDTINEYFTRAENFVINKATLSTEIFPPRFVRIKPALSVDMNAVYHRCYEGRITMYFAFVGMWKDGFPITEEDYDSFERFIIDEMDFPYISNYKDHMFDKEYCTDSISHLTREGAIIHSQILAREINAQMLLDGYK